MKKHIIPVLLLSSLVATSCGGDGSSWAASKAFEDKELNYCLLIGQIDHNDSAARTAGIRDALGTRADTKTSNANTESPKAGKLTLNGTEYVVNEIEHGEQKATGGATWDQQTATSSVEGWFNKHGDKIDFIVSNNDGMAEGAIAASSYISGTPIFGYDSNASTLQYIKDGRIMGTVNQNASAQVAGIFMMARNCIDGVANPWTVGFDNTSSSNGYGKISSKFTYNEDEKSLLVDNFAITSANVDQYLNKTAAQLVDANVSKGTTAEKKVLFTTYSSSDTFLNSSVKPLVNEYKDLFNFNITTVDGDGNSDSSLLDKMVNTYDAYIVNTIKTTSAASYLDKIYTLEGGSGKVSKPVIFYNRQPTDSQNVVDTTVMTDSRFESIYYVGFDANQGGQIQGEMIVNYLKEQEKSK